MDNPVNLPPFWGLGIRIVIWLAVLQPVDQLRAQDTANEPRGAVRLEWRSLPSLPDPLGLAGPLVGVHDHFLLVGGGANFARPVWDHPKQWHDQLFMIDLDKEADGWKAAGRLPAACAYAACVSTGHGIVVIGGNDAMSTFNRCWLIRCQTDSSVDWVRLPDLPVPLAYGQAAIASDIVYVGTGQTGSSLESSVADLWALDLKAWRNEADRARLSWQALPPCPGGPRAFSILAAKASRHQSTLVVLGGRRQSGEKVEFLNDVWRLNLSDSTWRQGMPAPVAIAAGGAGFIDEEHLVITSGDDGRLFTQTEVLRDNHPGFAKRTWIYSLAADRWSSGGPSPANQVTTPPVAAGNRILIASGELRPRVRTPAVWEIRAIPMR